VFDSSLSGCPGDTSPGGGSTVITKTGTLLVDGKGFGGTVLGDQRSIDNSGTISLSNVGFVLMNGGTTLTDEPGSGLNLDGQGGVYRGAKEGSSQAPSIVQTGAVTVDAPSTSVLGAAVTLLAPGKREVVVRNGGLALDAPKAPVARLARNTTYGVGSCVESKNQMCRSGDATSERPQAALVTTSTLAPKTSKVGVALAAGPKKVHGKKVIGKAVNVKAPTIKTTHATHIGFGFDTTTKGISAHTKPSVYRNGHVITLCKVHGITATNTSCIFSEGPPKKGGADTKGDLSVVVISIQPNAHWLVAK
jgi:hypothetical protein